MRISMICLNLILVPLFFYLLGLVFDLVCNAWRNFSIMANETKSIEVLFLLFK